MDDYRHSCLAANRVKIWSSFCNNELYYSFTHACSSSPAPALQCAHLQGDPGDRGCRIRIMKQHIANFLGNPTRFLNDPRNQKILVVSGFVILFSCLLFILFGTATRHGETASAEGTTATPVSTTPTITPTKWWIKLTPTSSPAPSSITAPTDPAGMSVSDCPSNFSSPLQSGIYAYISLTPPLPNRIRSGASKANSYLGQIEPGGGVRVLDGPLCADSFSWWLVESIQGGLRGWTAEGKGSEQWVIPCPDQTVACNKKPAPTPSSLASSPSPSKDKDKNKDQRCKLDKLTVGILAQVEQGSLLVIRSEPNTGDVVGRASPLSVVNIVDGPACAGGAVWFKVSITALNLSGWATENNLSPCSKEDECS